MISRNFIKYALIGVVNTSVGFGVIFLLMYLSVVAEISNLIGYIVGFFVSYTLNRSYNFKSRNRHREDFPKFLVSMAIAYILNLLTLVILYRVLEFNPYFAQILAGVIYTLSGYTLSKYWVFKES